MKFDLKVFLCVKKLDFPFCILQLCQSLDKEKCVGFGSGHSPSSKSHLLQEGWRKCEGPVIREVRGVRETANSIQNANTTNINTTLICPEGSEYIESAKKL